MELGARTFLNKPCSKDVLNEVLQEIAKERGLA
jgi:YesN/AraC family two-component response regulator